MWTQRETATSPPSLNTETLNKVSKHLKEEKELDTIWVSQNKDGQDPALELKTGNW